MPHRLVASAAVGAMAGAFLGAASLLFGPVPAGNPGSHPVFLGRVCIFLLPLLLTAGVGILGGLLSLVSLRWRRPAQAIFATVLWLWLVAFTSDLIYRHLLGVRPTRSLFGHIVTHLGPYLDLLPRSLAIEGAITFLLLAGACALLGHLWWRIAARMRALRGWAAGAIVVLTLGVVAFFSSPPETAFASWVHRGVPILAFGLGDLPIGTEFSGPRIAPIRVTLGAPLGTPDAEPIAAPSKRPNVLLIVLESISIGKVGYGGATRPVTPNIDKLAAGSRRMRRAWSAASVTNSAVSALLSSTLPRRQWQYDLFKNTDYPHETLFSVFGRQGIDTASIASDDQSSYGLRAFLASAPAKLMLEDKDFTGEHFRCAEDRSADDREVVSRAIDWISEPHEPWMLYINLQRTHVPYKLPAGVAYPYQPADVGILYPTEDLPKVLNRYDGTLQFVDSQVGRLLDALDATRSAENTLVVLVADHGEAFGEHGIFTHARTIYESETRVPLLFRWPGHVEPGDDDTPVSALDVAPTILGLTGAPLPAAMQGSNLFDGHARERAVILEIEAIGSQDGVVCWPWKLIVDHSAGKVSLFDLSSDPGELDDRAEIRASVTASMLSVSEGMTAAQVDYYQKGDTGLRNPPRIPSCPAL